jgi:hypothetical protein
MIAGDPSGDALGRQLISALTVPRLGLHFARFCSALRDRIDSVRNVCALDQVVSGTPRAIAVLFRDAADHTPNYRGDGAVESAAAMRRRSSRRRLRAR